MAVGYAFRRPALAVPISELWNGQSWRMHSTPKVGKEHVGSFRAVSCSGPNDCTAVGSFLFHPLDDDTGTLAEHWNGQRWQLRGPLGPSSQGALEGVSCLPRAGCVAVGGIGLDQGQPGIPIAQRWNGHSCIAVGARFSGRHTLPLAEATAG
jgi:hypothetical protein